MIRRDPLGHVWVLNPGAERELTAQSSTKRRTLEQMKERSHLFDDLCAGEPRVWLEELRSERPEVGGATRALLWCPTPGAQKLCSARGLLPQAAPSTAVLERVLKKSFLAAAMPTWLPPHHRLVRSLADFDAARRDARSSLRVKRLDGYAGKGQRVLSLSERAGDRLWLEQNLGPEGLVVEAELSPLEELSIHGVVTHAEPLVGMPCRLLVDGQRAPLSAPVAVPGTPHAPDIRRAGHDAARALALAGYFGPFGLDLILTREGLYATDLNARFTLGFSAGLGPMRERALAIILSSADVTRSP